MRRCHLDVETYSEVDLKASGVYVYAEHESTEILCAAFAFDHEEPALWIPRESIPAALLTAVKSRLPNTRIAVQREVPSDLREHLEIGGEVRAHNAGFERTVLNGVAGERLNFPTLNISQMRCTAAKSRTHGLPGALDAVASALGTFAKMEDGRGAMLQLSKPRTGKETRYTPENSPDKFLTLYAYVLDDVRAERGVDDYLPDLTPSEQRVWELDQKINDKGVALDLAAIGDVQALINEHKKNLLDLCFKWTGVKPTQRDKVAEWIRANGYPQLIDLKADTVKSVVGVDDLGLKGDPECPDKVKDVLRLYSTYGMKAVSKYEAMKKAVCKDGRIRGMFVFYGAGTGRWSSMIVQLQNLYRPKIKDPNTAIDAFRARNLDWIKFLYPHLDAMKVFASCVRGVLVPEHGKDIMALDFAGVESRFTAWMYDEHWKLEAFRKADRKEGPDTYRLAYARGFGIDPLEVNGDQRQIGKVLELAFGFEGGVGACVKAAETYQINLDKLTLAVLPNLPEHARESAEWMWTNYELKNGRPSKLDHDVYVACDGLKQLWRGTHPNIKQGWKNILEASKLAVLRPDMAYAIPNKKVMFKVWRDWLVMRLPSGRKLYYFKPELHDKTPKNAYGTELDRLKAKKAAKTPVSNEEWVQASYHDNGLKFLNLTYLGVDTKSRRWMRVGTYGGKETENAAQAGSSCLIRRGLLALDAANYDLIMSVHDEAALEIKEGFGSLAEASRLITDQEDWDRTLPLVAEGYREKRYKKH